MSGNLDDLNRFMKGGVPNIKNSANLKKKQKEQLQERVSLIMGQAVYSALELAAMIQGATGKLVMPERTASMQQKIFNYIIGVKDITTLEDIYDMEDRKVVLNVFIKGDVIAGYKSRNYQEILNDLFNRADEYSRLNSVK